MAKAAVVAKVYGHGLPSLVGYGQAMVLGIVVLGGLGRRCGGKGVWWW